MSQAILNEESTIETQITENTGGEFERTPVPESKLKSWKSFLGMYAGEHAAGTEFMIGPLFLTAGVSQDVLHCSAAIMTGMQSSLSKRLR